MFEASGLIKTLKGSNPLNATKRSPAATVYEGGLTRRGGEGRGEQEGRREKNLDKAKLSKQSPHQKESCFISLNFPASLPKDISPPSTLINSSLELSTFFKKQ